MKPILLTSIVLLSLFYAHAGAIQAVLNNGSWTNTSTWDLNRVPANSDLVTLPAGITVTINSNINTPGNTLIINVYGTLTFVGGGSKLSISGTSSIVVYGGGMINSTGSPSQTISIGSNIVYQGNQPPITGSQYADNTTGSGFFPFITLPVKFISFSLAAKNNSVLIQWSTSEEINSYKYEIERSQDGSNWSLIAQIEAAGISTTIKNYSYTDYLTIQSKIYYRIKQIDKNGNYTYTPIKELLTGENKNNNIKIASTGQSSILLQFPEMINDNLEVRIISFSGQILSITQLSKPYGQQIINTNKKGNFIISVTNNKNINISRQVVL